MHHYAGSAARIKANPMQGHDAIITKIRKSRLRRKGGGRKQKPPGEGKTAQFQARITADLRVALDTEAAATGRSVSAIASGLLRDGLRLRREREFERDDPMRALWYLIAVAARVTCGSGISRRPKAGPRLAHESIRLRNAQARDRGDHERAQTTRGRFDPRRPRS